METAMVIIPKMHQSNGGSPKETMGLPPQTYSAPPVPLLAITVIIIFFLSTSALFGFYKKESHRSKPFRSEFRLYLILIVLFLVLLYVAWRMFWDSFILGTRPSNCYGPQVNQVVDGVNGSGGSGGLPVMMAAVFLALALALVFCNPVLSVPVALAGAVNLLATVL